MIQVRRISHATLETPDLEKAMDHLEKVMVFAEKQLGAETDSSRRGA